MNNMLEATRLFNNLTKQEKELFMSNLETASQGYLEPISTSELISQLEDSFLKESIRMVTQLERNYSLENSIVYKDEFIGWCLEHIPDMIRIMKEENEYADMYRGLE